MERFDPVVKKLSYSLLFSRKVKVKCCIKLILYFIVCWCESLTFMVTEENTGDAEGNISA